MSMYMYLCFGFVFFFVYVYTCMIMWCVARCSWPWAQKQQNKLSSSAVHVHSRFTRLNFRNKFHSTAYCCSVHTRRRFSYMFLWFNNIKISRRSSCFFSNNNFLLSLFFVHCFSPSVCIRKKCWVWWFYFDFISMVLSCNQ